MNWDKASREYREAQHFDYSAWYDTIGDRDVERDQLAQERLAQRRAERSGVRSKGPRSNLNKKPAKKKAASRSAKKLRAEAEARRLGISVTELRRRRRREHAKNESLAREAKQRGITTKQLRALRKKETVREQVATTEAQVTPRASAGGADGQRSAKLDQVATLWGRAGKRSAAETASFRSALETTGELWTYSVTKDVKPVTTGKETASQLEARARMLRQRRLGPSSGQQDRRARPLRGGAQSSSLRTGSEASPLSR